jgi:uncharacterized protein (TIGR02246 family)
MAARRWGIDSLGAAVAMASRYQPPLRVNIFPAVSPDSPAALSAAFAAAINARDVEGALALWIEDAAILRPDGETVRGREAIGAALHALVDNGVSVEVDVAELYAAGDVALAVGTLTINGTDGDGRPYSQRSQSVVIYTRGSDGEWRLAIDAPWGLPSV